VEKTAIQKHVGRYERILKDLDVATRRAHAGSLAARSLADKLRMVKLERVVATARNALRLTYYEYEDAGVFIESARRDNG
jgi:hypothetical protein